MPTREIGAFTHDRAALVRPRPVADEVAQAPDRVGRLGVDAFEHRLERVQICANVGDDGDAHGSGGDPADRRALARRGVPPLWQTEVPDGLRLPDLEERRFFGSAALADYEHHDQVLRARVLAALAAELIGLGLLRAVPAWVRGPGAVQAAQLGALAACAAFVARLPFALAIVWWQRRRELRV